jgi:uncharacterized protein
MAKIEYLCNLLMEVSSTSKSLRKVGAILVSVLLLGTGVNADNKKISITITQRAPIEMVSPAGDILGVTEATVGTQLTLVSANGSQLTLQDSQGTHYVVAQSATDYTPPPLVNSPPAPIAQAVPAPAPAQVEATLMLVLPPATAAHLDVLTKAAEGGNSEAMIRLGDIYRSGNRGVARDRPKALVWYRKAADLGAPLGMYYAGSACKFGWSGAAKDQTQADVWYQKALAAANDLAARNDSDAMLCLGLLYNYGDGVPKDLPKALAWYLKGAVTNDAAMYMAGYLYQYGEGTTKDLSEALSWYRKAADAGDPDAFYAIGWMYQKGSGVPEDMTQALAWFNKAIDAGNSDAVTHLGHVYGYGVNVQQDQAKALQYYLQGASLGNSYSMGSLGKVYANGWGVERDYDKALAWYQKGATLGDPDAMWGLGCLYLNGLGVEKDLGQAFSWFQKSDAAGSKQAHSYLGWMYANGWGVPKDYGKAVTLVRQVLDQDDGQGLAFLGYFYENGWGVDVDDAKALDCYLKSAAAGNGRGMSFLASMYERGVGTPKDMTAAGKWYTQAAASGDATAEDWVHHHTLGSQAQGDELLNNSNFALGNSHWDGDGEKIIQDTTDHADPNLDSTDPTGLTVKLKSAKWTKVTQDFDSRSGNLRLIIVYSVSLDFKLSDRGNDYTDLPQNIDLSYWDPFATNTGTWVAMLCDVAGRHQTYVEIPPPPAASNSQTFTHVLTATSDQKKTICLAFPPGQGTITLHKVSLIPDHD